MGFIKASNPGGNDNFGYQVSLSGTSEVGQILAVGANYEDADDLENTGAVYVYERRGSWWKWADPIRANDKSGGDQFGSVVNLSSDGKTLAVGVPFRDSSTGAVYVFQRSDISGDWTQQAPLIANDAAKYNSFGTKVDLSNDGNTLVVGAGGRDTFTGAVYTYSRQDTSQAWTKLGQPIKASNADTNDGFGYRLSLSGDGKTLAVVSQFEDSGANGIKSSLDIDPDDNSVKESGAVYIFTRDDGDWLEKTFIKANNPAENEIYGYGVNLSGDGNTLVVGGAADPGGEIFDKVYIY